jgi:hypothetical protein
MKNTKKAQTLKLKRNQKSARYFYESLRAEIEAVQDGKLRVPGLGVFTIKATSKEVDGQPVSGKRIILRLSDPSARRQGDATAGENEPEAGVE